MEKDGYIWMSYGVQWQLLGSWSIPIPKQGPALKVLWQTSGERATIRFHLDKPGVFFLGNLRFFWVNPSENGSHWSWTWLMTTMSTISSPILHPYRRIKPCGSSLLNHSGPWFLDVSRVVFHIRGKGLMLQANEAQRLPGAWALGWGLGDINLTKRMAEFMMDIMTTSGITPGIIELFLFLNLMWAFGKCCECFIWGGLL